MARDGQEDEERICDRAGAGEEYSAAGVGSGSSGGRTRPRVVFTNVQSVERIIYAIFNGWNENYQ